jgi:heme-degrading monooxygenase HmoA
MFARIVSMRLKPGAHNELTTTFEKQVIPTLRKQQGFKDELLFVAPGNEAVGISLWESKESAETYNRAVYPELLKTLTHSIEGTPEVRTFEVASSTSHRISAPVAA